METDVHLFHFLLVRVLGVRACAAVYRKMVPAVHWADRGLWGADPFLSVGVVRPPRVYQEAQKQGGCLS